MVYTGTFLFRTPNNNLIKKKSTTEKEGVLKCRKIYIGFDKTNIYILDATHPTTFQAENLQKRSSCSTMLLCPLHV